MNKLWQILSMRLDKLRRRERIMVLVAGLFLLGFIFNQLFFDKLFKERQTLKKEMATTQEQVNMLSQQLKVVEQEPVQDINQLKKQLLAQRISERDLVLKELDLQQKDLVSPKEMVQLLTDLLQANPKLSVLSFKTLKPIVLSINHDQEKDKVEDKKEETDNQQDKEPQVKEPQRVAVYQQGVELELSGKYFDLLDAVKKIEQLPWNFIWGEVVLVEDHYPNTKLKLTVYTLSMEETWLTL